MIPLASMDPSALAIVARELEKPLSQEEQDAIRSMCLDVGAPIPACLERRAEERDSDWRTEKH